MALNLRIAEAAILTVDGLSALSSEQIIDLWRQAREKSAPHRALLLLEAAFPRATSTDLQGLTLGQRDAVLFRLRELTFGPSLECVGECPYCLSLASVSVEIPGLLVSPGGRKREVEFLYEGAGFQIRYRGLTVGDLLGISSLDDTGEARQALLGNCIVSVREHGQAVAVARIPEQVQTQLGSALAASDPDSEIWIDQRCPECGEEFESLLDIADFLWREISVEARRTSAELDHLATAYGWSKAKILQMSRARRRIYMEATGE
jgi:hypothetical protein